MIKKKWLPQKNDFTKMVTPQKNAYFIARGLIIEFWKNRVLCFVRVYKCDSNIMGNIWENHWFPPESKPEIGMKNGVLPGGHKCRG